MVERLGEAHAGIPGLTAGRTAARGSIGRRFGDGSAGELGGTGIVVFTIAERDRNRVTGCARLVSDHGVEVQHDARAAFDLHRGNALRRSNADGL